MIMDADTMKALFLKTIERAKQRFRFTIENFCIMGNHYHIIIRPSKSENLSRIMQWIMSVFAMAYNRELGINGHVWGGRFFSRIINDIREYVHIYKYIDANPARANLVMAASDWKYGGAFHRKRRDLSILDPLPRIFSVAIRLVGYADQ
jgi:putative transposase